VVEVEEDCMQSSCVPTQDCCSSFTLQEAEGACGFFFVSFSSLGPPAR
jgi:hypothetical protein